MKIEGEPELVFLLIQCSTHDQQGNYGNRRVRYQQNIAIFFQGKRERENFDASLWNRGGKNLLGKARF